MTQLVNELLKKPIMHYLVISNPLFGGLETGWNLNYIILVFWVNQTSSLSNSEIFIISPFFQKNGLLKIILPENSGWKWKLVILSLVHGKINKGNLNTFSPCALLLLCWFLKNKVYFLNSYWSSDSLPWEKKTREQQLICITKKMLEGRRKILLLL